MPVSILSARVLGHLGALVPGQRTTQFLGQGHDGARDGIANGLGTMTSESRSILGARCRRHGRPVAADATAS